MLGDSGREGEYIQRLVFMMAEPNPNAEMKRVWIDSQTEDEILKARFAVKRLGGEMESAVSMFLPGTNVERIFIPIKKVGITPEKYPRKAGMPSKEPLK